MDIRDFSGPFRYGARVRGESITPDITNAVIGTAAGFRIARGVASVANGGTIATGLTTVVAAFLTPAVAARAAQVTVLGPTLTIGLFDLATPTAIAVAESVYWLAIGT